MDRVELSTIAHMDHPIAAPISAVNLHRLVASLSPPMRGRVADLGCGSGWWLTELLAARPDLSGTGVDVSVPAGAQLHARERGVADRVTWVQTDAAAWTDGHFDVVVCVGASHAFGGLAGTLEAVRRSLRPGGQVLLGDTIWETSPSALAQEALAAGPDDFPDLAGLVQQARESQFETGYGHVSTLDEWDDYEWSWTGSLIRWALHPDRDPDDRNQALGAAQEHRQAWLNGYRKQLGFATLVLYDVAAGRAEFAPD